MRVGRIGRNIVNCVAPVAILLGLAACGAEVPSGQEAQGWELVKGGRGRTAVNPSQYMLAVGCLAYSGSTGLGIVGIEPNEGPPERFNCVGVPSDTIQAAMQRYIDASIAANGDANQMIGSWDLVSREYCYANSGYWQQDGSYYLPPGGTLTNCFWEDTWTLIVPDQPGWPPIPIAPSGGGGGGGAGGSGSGDGKPSVDIACTIPTEESETMEASEFFSKWDAPAPEGMEVCRTQGCMSQSPGIWIGVWPIQRLGGIVGHTAVYRAGASSGSVTELLGWSEYTTNHFNDSSSPEYGPFGSYKWVKLGGIEAMPTVEAGRVRAQAEFSGLPYSFGSNRYISNVLRYAGLAISEEVHAALGSVPGICSCNTICTH